MKLASLKLRARLYIFASHSALCILCPRNVRAFADVAEATEASVAPTPPVPRTASIALPFAQTPENLENYDAAGNYGFDPLGFTDWIKVDFLREAELKHGRIAQLAVVGFAATDLGVRLPGEVHQVSSVAAHDVALSYGAMNQLILWLSVFEIVSSVAVNQMINEGSGRLPGDFGLDPFKLTSNPAKAADLKLKEIVHCRLAMFAISGMITQAVLTGNGFPYTA